VRVFHGQAHGCVDKRTLDNVKREWMGRNMKDPVSTYEIDVVACQKPILEESER
jgi:hypothetical protein